MSGAEKQGGLPRRGRPTGGGSQMRAVVSGVNHLKGSGSLIGLPNSGHEPPGADLHAFVVWGLGVSNPGYPIGHRL